MMRRCEESVPLLGPWLDGELAEVDRSWLEEHVAGCASCAGRKALLLAQRDAIREHAVRGAASADLSRLAEVVLARIEKDRARAPAAHLRVWSTEMWRAHRAVLSTSAGLAIAACLALIVFLQPLRGQRGPTLVADNRMPVSIEEVDFDSQEGAVLQSGQTTVIWVDDAPVRR